MIKTLIVDIDGTILEQTDGTDYGCAKQHTLPGTLEKIREWEKKNYRLILITGRKESSRRITQETLEKLGIPYDQLIMGVGIGPRVLVNDLKPDHPDTMMAEAINLKRNEGIGNIKV